MAPNGRLQRRLYHQVDVDAQPVAQFVLQADELEQTGRFLELDQQIQVTIGSLVTPYIRAENAQRGNLVTG
jgi:CHASE3 domain sensor protein